MADPGPGPRPVVIAGVVAEGLADRGEIRADFRAGGVQERPEQDRRGGEGPSARHPRQPAEAGPSHDPVQDRLGLVVLRMADGHPRRTPGAGDLGQPGIAGPTRIGLEVPRAPRPPVPQVDRQPQAVGEPRHELRVRPRGLAPYPVVEVRHREPVRQLGGRRVQDPEQPDAVAPPGDGDYPRVSEAGVSPSLQDARDAGQPGVDTSSLCGSSREGSYHNTV